MMSSGTPERGGGGGGGGPEPEGRGGAVGGELVQVSIITPMRNAGEFLDEAARSVLAQSYEGQIEWCVYDDGSTDGSAAILEGHRGALQARGIRLRVVSSPEGAPAGGCGLGRNKLVEVCLGDHLCFFDADDVMRPGRVRAQLDLAQAHPGAIVGSRFVREPADATPRWTAWLNGMTQEQLRSQFLRECTLAMPTWMMHRRVFDAVGGFDGGSANNAEDLKFFYAHVARGGELVRADEELLVYRFHSCSVTGQRGVPWELIWGLRVEALEKQVLGEPPWSGGFTIWGAGKEGKRLYRSLCKESRAKVVAFCDVDERKIAHGVYEHMESGRRVPIVHFRDARPPLLLCVKGGLTGGEFEDNVESLGLKEGAEYLHFS